MPKPIPSPLLIPLDLHPATEAAAHVSQELAPPHWSSTSSFKGLFFYLRCWFGNMVLDFERFLVIYCLLVLVLT
nr:hypothetical protein CFP56_15298 [Quercus suber]